MQFEVDEVAKYIVSLHPDKLVSTLSCPDFPIAFLHFLEGGFPFMKLIACKPVIEGYRLDSHGYICGKDWPELEESIKELFHDEWDQVPDNVSEDSGYGYRRSVLTYSMLEEVMMPLPPVVTPEILETPLFEGDFKTLRRILLAKKGNQRNQRAIKESQKAKKQQTPRVHARNELLDT